MGLHVIKNDAVELTFGENKLLSKLRDLYKEIDHESYLYIQPKIGGLVPDFILIDSKRGISILEVKDWAINYIRNIDKRRVKLADREDDNPVFKTKKYKTILEGLISTLEEDIEELDSKIYAHAVLSKISKEETEKTNMNLYLSNSSVGYITSDEFKLLTIDRIFSKDIINLTTKDMVTIRTLLFPEIKIQKPTVIEEGSNIKKKIFSLTEEQENFARRLPYGPYVVAGLPGSGKTAMLLTRAIHLIKENPDWKILISTFNKALATKLECELNRVANEIKQNPYYQNIPIENIEVKSFHSLVRQLANLEPPANADQEWWDNMLPSKALEIARPTYDAILIDEYQDFKGDWIRVCLKLCKKHTYLNYDKKTTEGINLFMSGDRLQSIYNLVPHSWAKDFGISLRGRGKILKISYRTTKNILALALEFLKLNEALSKEVEVFYESAKGECVNESTHDSVEFVEGNMHTVAKTITSLIQQGYKYNDILIVCKYKKNCTAIKELLPDNIKANTTFVSEANDEEMRNNLLTATYHSSKGLESKVAIIVDVDQFTDQLDKAKEIIERKLLYVGITRASEKLIIHAKNFQRDSYAKDLKEVYENKIL